MVSVAQPGGTVAAEPASSRRSKALYLLPTLVLIAGGIGGILYGLGAGKETTDDAQVEGHVAYVAPHIGGQVKRVLVSDNQVVHAGDVLVELDDRDFKARLDAARADVNAARASLRASETELALTKKSVASDLSIAQGGLLQAVSAGESTRAAIEQARAELAAARSRQSLARTEFDRADSLYQSGAISKATYDNAKAQLEQADAGIAQAEARAASAEAGRKNSSGTLASAQGRITLARTGPEQINAAEARAELARAKVAQTQAALEQAELNQSYTTVRALVSGVVSRRSVEVGQMAAPEKPLLAIVPLDDTWVVANFKEDQIAHMAPGQRAKISLDAYDDKKLSGHVESLAGGTGARFALLPPDNASGNFTKVVQRVPVLIRLDAHPGVDLRPGLSAEVTVVTK